MPVVDGRGRGLSQVADERSEPVFRDRPVLSDPGGGGGREGLARPEEGREHPQDQLEKDLKLISDERQFFF